MAMEPAWRRLLEELDELRERVARVEYEAIQVLRENGTTWEDIGEALGISRQAARSRFGRPRHWRRT